MHYSLFLFIKFVIFFLQSHQFLFIVVNRAKVILPGDENFQSIQRIWNAMYDLKKPAIIVQVTGVSDVQACISYAQKVNIIVTPRGGGHSWAGFSTIEGGLVIDFTLMRSMLFVPIKSVNICLMILLQVLR